MKVIRHFVKPKSVYKEYNEDTERILDKAFALDKQFMKINKMVKDPAEVERIMLVLRKYYPQMRDQYINLIANKKSYPVINWLDYVNSCKTWKIIDRNLSSQDVDREFIAVNFEEVDLDANDDKSLCRYELFELTVRLAKVKFFEKKICASISEATEKLLKEYLIPNTCEEMPWQEFRSEHLWTLEIDDLLKAN